MFVAAASYNVALSRSVATGVSRGEYSSLNMLTKALACLRSQCNGNSKFDMLLPVLSAQNDKLPSPAARHVQKGLRCPATGGCVQMSFVHHARRIESDVAGKSGPRNSIKGQARGFQTKLVG